MIRSLWLKLRGLLARDRVERELEDELRFHLEMETEANLRRGMSPAEARRDAQLRFGGVERYKEQAREARGTRWLDDAAWDLRVSLRRLVRAPAFTSLCVLTLTLGIGANAAVFSVVRGVLLRPLPYPESERLVAVRARALADGYQYSLSQADLDAWRQLDLSFERVGAYYTLPSGLTLQGAGEATAVSAILVTTDLFEVLGVPPAIGRTFFPEESAPGVSVAVVSNGFWRAHLGSVPELSGASIVLDGQAVAVVGVMPASFRIEGAPAADVFLPLEEEMPERRGPFYMRGIGRLAGGTSVESARADLARATRAVDGRFPPESPGGWEFAFAALKDTLVRDARSTLWALFASVGLVLLIAIANAANLFLARASARETDRAVLSALGAGAWRLRRQQFAESLLISSAGALLGIALAYLGVPLVGRYTTELLPRAHEVTVDGGVLAFAALAALVAGVLVGVAPAGAGSRQPARGIREGGWGALPRRALLRRFLVASELALSFVVVTGAVLLVRSLGRLQAVDAGVLAEGVLTARVSLPDTRYPEPADYGTFFREVLLRLEGVPGVAGIAVSSSLPPDRLDFENLIAPEVYPQDRPTPIVHQALVSEDYFRLLGVPLLSGRAFLSTDGPDDPAVVIVSRSLAERFWPGEDAVGKVVDRGGAPATVVGVAEDVRYAGLAAGPSETFYTPYFQSLFFRSVYVTLRGSAPGGDPLPLAAALREELRALDRALVLREVAPMEQLFHDSVATPRFRTWLLSAFGLLALLLATAGVYGVLAFSVTERRRETGVRVALGARPRDVVRVVAQDGMRLVVTGLAAGALLALGAARLLEGLLFGVTPLDPWTYAASALLLALAGAIACGAPAYRAARQNPSDVLRQG